MNNLNMRRVLKTPTLRMMDGGTNWGTPEELATGAAVSQSNIASMNRAAATYKSFGQAPTASAAAPANPLLQTEEVGPTSKAQSPLRTPTPTPKAPTQTYFGPTDGREQTTLAFADGGQVSPWSIKGIANTVKGAFTETPEQGAARRAADYEKMKATAAARQPVAAPVAAPPKEISNYVSNPALQMREKAAGLRNGGELHCETGGTLRTGHGGAVPGTGQGDKIPAKYEPGEFVVSNDMLAAAPELREQLSGLREQVLAEKGMTPEEADAKAVSGKGLRAIHAGDWMANELTGKGNMPKPTPMGAMAEQLAKPVVEVPAAPKYTPPPVDPTTGRYASERIIQGGAAGGQAGPAGSSVGVGTPAPGVQAGGAGAGSSGRAGVLGSIREGLSHQPGPISKSTFLAGRVLANPLVQFGGKAAGGLGVVQNFNDYKINDPSVDSSAAGTWNALKQGDMAGTGRSLSKGLLETGMDLGSTVANTLDYVVPGKAPVSTAYGNMLRNTFGDQLQDNTGVPPKPSPVAGDVPALRTNARGQGFDDPRIIGKPTAGDRDRQGPPQGISWGGTAMSASDPGMMGIQARQDAGDAARLRQDQYAQQVNEAKAITDDGRRMNLMYDARNGTPAERKLAREILTQENGMKVEDRKNKNSLRIAEMGLQGDMYKADSSAQSARATALRDQKNKDREFDAGRSDKAFEQGGKANESARKALTIYGKDKDGKPYVDEDQTNAAFELAQRQNSKWATLSPDKQAAHLSDARDVTQLIGNLDKNQNNTWWQKYGLGNNEAKMSHLPNLKGATMETLGAIDGAATAGASKGDYRLMVGGKALYLSRGDVSKDQLAFLERQGVKVKKD